MQNSILYYYFDLTAQRMPDVHSGQPISIDELKVRLEAKIAALRGELMLINFF